MAGANQEKIGDSPRDSRDVEQQDAVQEPVCPPHTTEARLLAKIDWHVVPWLCLMYLLAFLDRVNISNANSFGLSQDLNLGTGTKFNTALVIFFVPYCVFEIPSNMLLKKFKPHVWLAGSMFLFGFTMMMQGLVKSYGGLLAARFFLGLFETGMFPGAFYLIGMWYKRGEAQKRYTFFFSSTSLAGAFGGLLAAAIGKMDHMRGFRGWRWIFIIEGGLTIVGAVLLYFLLPDFPEDVKWLNEDERKFIQARLRVDQRLASGHERKFTRSRILSVMKDLKVLFATGIYFGFIVSAYGYAYFATAIITTFHYSPIETQLRSVPPWAVSFAFSIAIAAISDRVRHRFLFVVVACFIAIIGYAILLAVHDKHNVQYGALFLVTSGVFTGMPICICWHNMNLGGHVRRSVGSAWQIGVGNLAAFIAVYIFLAKDAPRYTVGYSVGLAFVIFSLICSILYAWACWQSNREKDAAGDAPLLSEEEKQELGDLAPDYRYLL